MSSKRVKLPKKGMDETCRKLCEALNTMPGIATYASCCGHGRQPFRIWFEAKRLQDLPPVLFFFSCAHVRFTGWRVLAITECDCQTATFCIEGPVGREAYKMADRIAGRIRELI